MNENNRFGTSRGRVGTSTKAVDTEANSQSKAPITRHPVAKKHSWTSLTTKARRLGKKRRSSLLGSSKTRKGNENNPPNTQRAHQNHWKSLEDYASWCNHYLLRGLHREISPDLRTAVGDGVTFINLVESLTSKSIRGVSRQPVTWSQKLENIRVCFQFLVSEGVRVSGISPEDVIEGQLSSIVTLFQRLEMHYDFEHMRYSREYMDENCPQNPLALAGHGKNGRMSSGYHSEDDGYNGGRTTPIIDALPGLLAGSGTNSDTDDDIIEPSSIHLHHDDRMAQSVQDPSPNGYPVSRIHHNAPTIFYRGVDEYRNSRSEETLDKIGYMPSHPSTKARASPSKVRYDKRSESGPCPEHNRSDHKTIVTPSHVKMATPGHAVLLRSEDVGNTIHGRDNLGMDFTGSDFGLDDSTSLDRQSISSAGTPVLPDLSSTSSFEDPPLDFSSDASGFATSTRLLQDPLASAEPYNTMDLQKQIESLHHMYQKLLVHVGKDNQETKRKNKLSLPKLSAIQAKHRSSSKQRTKDLKSVSRRFTRIESHVVTLARSVDHLRSEIRTQADTSLRVEELRADVNEFKDSVYSNNFHIRHLQKSRDYKQRLHRLQKLTRFFGEEPPMVALLLQRMGYEKLKDLWQQRFIPHFKAEEIGILELPYMTEQRLQNLGIPLGPRLRILEEIENLRYPRNIAALRVVITEQKTTIGPTCCRSL